MENNNGFVVFAGNSNRDLAKGVCKILGVDLGPALVGIFSDRETQVKIDQNVRKKDAYVIQSTSEPANDHYMELFIMADALKRASAQSMTAVIPFFGYARQDRKAAPRTPITAKLMADLLTTAGYDRIITFDLHAGQIQGFFNIPVDNLYASIVFLDFIEKNFVDVIRNIVIVAPDAGGAVRARAYAKRLKVGMALIDKERVMPGKSKAVDLIGDVQGKIAIVIDDIIDTAGTLTEGAELLLEKGADKVVAMGTHAVLSGPAIDRINQSKIEKVYVTNTIRLGDKDTCRKIEVLSITELLAKAVLNCHNGESIANLF
jgi:ribose-phosphate pyrophosphokinase